MGITQDSITGNSAYGELRVRVIILHLTAVAVALFEGVFPGGGWGGVPVSSSLTWIKIKPCFAHKLTV
jgi:hypothetical protein